MKNGWLRLGGIYGLFNFFFVLLWYYGLIGMGLSSVFGIVIITLIFWFAAREQKTKNGGFATFGELFKIFFMITILGLIISLIFNMIHNNLISDEVKDEIVERYIQSQLGMYKFFGFGEDMIISLEDSLRQTMTAEKLFGIMNLLVSMISSFFIAMIFALIGGVLFKRVPKEV